MKQSNQKTRSFHAGILCTSKSTGLRGMCGQSLALYGLGAVHF